MRTWYNIILVHKSIKSRKVRVATGKYERVIVAACWENMETACDRVAPVSASSPERAIGAWSSLPQKTTSYDINLGACLQAFLLARRGAGSGSRATFFFFSFPERFRVSSSFNRQKCRCPRVQFSVMPGTYVLTYVHLSLLQHVYVSRAQYSTNSVGIGY